MIADQFDEITSRQIAATSLRTFMRLPVAQRASVILMDVLGCSLQEICEVMDFSLPAVKAALHRGRTQLREYADEPDDAPRPTLSETDRERLSAYVAHFNARDFDAIRAMLADDVRLDLVSRVRLNGKAEVSRYLAIIRKSAIGTWCPEWWRGTRPSWYSIPPRPQRRRNILSCWAGGATSSRPSGTSATRPM